MKFKSAKATRIDVQKDGSQKVVYRDRDVLTRREPGDKRDAPKLSKRRKSA